MVSRTTQSVAGMAALSAAFCTHGTAFVSTPALRPSAAAHGAASSAGTTESPRVGAAFGAAAVPAACTLAAAAGVAALSRRRLKTCTKVVNKPIQVIEWQVDPMEPVPGSEKALAGMVGADVETGGEPWDPLGFSKLYDRNFDFNMVMTYPHVQWLREAELKHGRVCMLAFVGMVVQQFTHIPGYPAEPDWIKALDACQAEKLPALGLAQIAVFCMLVEGRWYPEGAWVGQMDREPGDLGFDPLKLTKKPGFDFKTMQLKEIKNGRLAMIGVASMAANHTIPGSVPFLNGFYAERPDIRPSPKPAALCGRTGPAARVAPQPPRTAARYTTQVILPALTWIKSGVSAGDLAPTELRAKTLAGTDVLIGKDGAGKLFCVGNLCPHIGTPMSEGADVIGDVIVCPLHGSSFKVTTGELIDWCVSPPIIGPLTGLVIEKKNLAVFEIRTGLFGGGEVEVLIDTNAKRAYESNYWKGVLDAQGKDDGTYY